MNVVVTGIAAALVLGVLDDVSFSYEEGVSVLKGVSLPAKPVQIVALVGPTGAGKTTIVNVLTRFYEIDSGRVTIDGRALRRISPRGGGTSRGCPSTSASRRSSGRSARTSPRRPR